MNVRVPIVIKLGGSILTDKHGGKPALKERVVRRLARDIARNCRKETLVLLHGGGSFGHPLAHRYGLVGKRLSRGNFLGVGMTISAMRELGTRLATAFFAAGLPVIPLQTSSFIRKERGKLVGDFTTVEHILAKGGIPLLGGDVVIERGRSVIASADALAVALAKRFHARKIFFATDVAGIYERFPIRQGARPLRMADRATIRRIASSNTSRNQYDVTGDMGGKLASLSPLRNCEVTIFNGLTPGAFARALKKKTGTRIVL